MKTSGTGCRVITVLVQYGEAYRANKDQHGISHELTIDSLHCLSSVLTSKGDHRKAVILLERVFETLSKAHELRGELSKMAAIADSIGSAYLKLEEPLKAREWYRQALELDEQNPDPERIPIGLLNLAAASIFTGHYEESERLLDRFDQTPTGIKEGEHEGRSMELRLEILTKKQQLNTARDLCKEMIAFWDSRGNEERAAWGEFLLGEILISLGSFDDGFKCFRNYISRLERSSYTFPLCVEGLEAVAAGYRNHGRQAEAIDVQRRVDDIRRISMQKPIHVTREK